MLIIESAASPTQRWKYLDSLHSFRQNKTPETVSVRQILHPNKIERMCRPALQTFAYKITVGSLKSRDCRFSLLLPALWLEHEPITTVRPRSFPLSQINADKIGLTATLHSTSRDAFSYPFFVIQQ